jgi:phage recombination protein Bet
MSELAVSHLDSDRLDLLKRTICKGASTEELELFAAVCNRTGLDPFARQIYAVRRWDNRLGREIQQTQVSIDGFRLVAQRSGEYAGQTPVQWCGQDGQWRDIWLGEHIPAAARVGVYRRGFAEPCYAIALWSEYVQTKKDGSPTGMWSRMPTLMLAKCAEALALRKAFPAELSGLYSEDEMGQADNDAQPTPKAIPEPKAKAVSPAAMRQMTREERRADTEALLSPTPKALPVEIPIDGGSDQVAIEPPNSVTLTPKSTKIAKIPDSAWWRVDVDHDEKPFAVNDSQIADAIEASIAFNATVRAFYSMAGTKRVIVDLEEVGHG